jgi:hypothetical protein
MPTRTALARNTYAGTCTLHDNADLFATPLYQIPEKKAIVLFMK